jgi:hypothetical protein
MELTDFKFRSNISLLNQSELDLAYDEVTTLFYGVSELWSTLPAAVSALKKLLCYNFLIAWYLCEKYPTRVTGVDADGRPLTSKSIGGVSVSLASIQGQNAMILLTSNSFGIKAKAMMEAAPEMLGIYR